MTLFLSILVFLLFASVPALLIYNPDQSRKRHNNRKNNQDKQLDVWDKPFSVNRGKRYSNKTVSNQRRAFSYSRGGSSDNKIRTEMGVFTEPVSITFNGETVTCGIFNERGTYGGEKSLFFRFPGGDILKKNFEGVNYLRTILFAYDTDEKVKQFVSLNPSYIKNISYERYKHLKLYLWTEGYFYFLDERDNYKLRMYNHNKDNHRVRISKDGNRLIFSGLNELEDEVFDISSGRLELMSTRHYSTFQLPTIQPDLPKVYHFYYSADNSKPSHIINKYIKMHPELEYKIMANEFSDDTSVNIDVSVPTSNKEAMALCGYADGLINKYVIYGFSPSDIVDIAGETHRYYGYLLGKVSKTKKEECEIILEKIKKKHRYSTEKALKYLFYKYCGYEKTDPGSKSDYGRNIYRDTFQQMVDDGESKTRWKSELQMYNLIHKYYDNSVFQFRDDKLLGLQSFDTYLPDLKVAFEYQGRQHYEPIEFFGGEEGFRRVKERDERKKAICKENGISLIEWKYDEPITAVRLKKKLAVVGITLSK